MISFMKKIYSKHYQKDIITDRNVKLWKKLEELADYKSEISKEDPNTNCIDMLLEMLKESLKNFTKCASNQVQSEVVIEEKIEIIEESEEEKAEKLKLSKQKSIIAELEEKFHNKQDIILAKYLY